MKISTLRRGRPAAIALAALALAAPAQAAGDDTIVDVTVNDYIAITATPNVAPATNLNVGENAFMSAPVTVYSNVANGYSLSVSRTAFSNGDIPMAAGMGAIPFGPSVSLLLTGLTDIPVGGSLELGRRTADITPVDGDYWGVDLRVGPVPLGIAAGAHQSTVTFTAVGL